MAFEIKYDSSWLRNLGRRRGLNKHNMFELCANLVTQ